MTEKINDTQETQSTEKIHRMDPVSADYWLAAEMVFYERFPVDFPKAFRKVMKKTLEKFQYMKNVRYQFCTIPEKLHHIYMDCLLEIFQCKVYLKIDSSQELTDPILINLKETYGNEDWLRQQVENFDIAWWGFEGSGIPSGDYNIPYLEGSRNGHKIDMVKTIEDMFGINVEKMSIDKYDPEWI